MKVETGRSHDQEAVVAVVICVTVVYNQLLHPDIHR